MKIQLLTSTNKGEEGGIVLIFYIYDPFILIILNNYFVFCYSKI